MAALLTRKFQPTAATLQPMMRISPPTPCAAHVVVALAHHHGRRRRLRSRRLCRHRLGCPPGATACSDSDAGATLKGLDCSSYCRTAPAAGRPGGLLVQHHVLRMWWRHCPARRHGRRRRSRRLYRRVAPGATACVDTDGGATDSAGDTCSYYRSTCPAATLTGSYKTTAARGRRGLSSNTMCCACGVAFAAARPHRHRCRSIPPPMLPPAPLHASTRTKVRPTSTAITATFTGESRPMLLLRRCLLLLQRER